MGYLKKTWDSFINFILEVWMGFLLCLIIAIPAFFLGKLVPIIGGPVFAILAGMIITLFIKDKSKLAGGITFTSKKILQYAVILLGFGLNLSVVVKTGAQSLPIILSTIATSLIISYALCKVMKIPSKISTLVGVGSSICGGSAVAATAPVIDASDEEVALAISVIFLFNIIAAIVFPSFGRLLGFSKTSGEAFGVFAGTAINDTSSVTAAASTWDAMFDLGSETLDKAVTVKLTRTLAIIPITLVLAFVRTRKAKKAIKMARAAKKAKEINSKAEKIEMENLDKKSSSIVNIPPFSPTETDVVKVEPVVESSIGDSESVPVSSEEETKKDEKKAIVEEDDDEKELESVDFMKIFPFFIIYFIIASIITTIATNLCGVSNSFFDPIKELSKFFIILAMSAVGINTNIVKLIKSGGKPIFMGLCCWVGITAVSLLMQKILNLW